MIILILLIELIKLCLTWLPLYFSMPMCLSVMVIISRAPILSSEVCIGEPMSV